MLTCLRVDGRADGRAEPAADLVRVPVDDALEQGPVSNGVCGHECCALRATKRALVTVPCTMRRIVQFVRTASSYDNYGLAIGAFMRWAGWTRAVVAASSLSRIGPLKTFQTVVEKTVGKITDPAVKTEIQMFFFKPFDSGDSYTETIASGRFDKLHNKCVLTGIKMVVSIGSALDIQMLALFAARKQMTELGWAWLTCADVQGSAKALSAGLRRELADGLDGWVYFKPGTRQPTNGSASLAVGNDVAARLSDAIVLYAHGAQRVLSRSGNVRNGTAVVEAMLSESFAGETGMVHLDSNGDLVESYSVFNYVLQDGVLSSVLVGECGGLSSSDGGCAIKQKVRWPGGSSDVPSSKGAFHGFSCPPLYLDRKW